MINKRQDVYFVYIVLHSYINKSVQLMLMLLKTILTLYHLDKDEDKDARYCFAQFARRLQSIFFKYVQIHMLK